MPKMQVGCGGKNWLTNYNLMLFLVNVLYLKIINYNLSYKLTSLMKCKIFLLEEWLNTFLRLVWK